MSRSNKDRGEQFKYQTQTGQRPCISQAQVDRHYLFSFLSSLVYHDKYVPFVHDSLLYAKRHGRALQLRCMRFPLFIEKPSPVNKKKCALFEIILDESSSYTVRHIVHLHLVLFCPRTLYRVCMCTLRGRRSAQTARLGIFKLENKRKIKSTNPNEPKLPSRSFLLCAAARCRRLVKVDRQRQTGCRLLQALL